MYSMFDTGEIDLMDDDEYDRLRPLTEKEIEDMWLRACDDYDLAMESY